MNRNLRTILVPIDFCPIHKPNSDQGTYTPHTIVPTEILDIPTALIHRYKDSNSIDLILYLVFFQLSYHNKLFFVVRANNASDPSPRLVKILVVFGSLW